MRRVMILQTTLDGAVLTVMVQDSRLDAAIATAFKDEMRRAMGQGGQTVVLDLEAVDFMDSSGLGALIAVRKALPPGRQLELAGLQPNVIRVLRLTRMDTVFKINSLAGAVPEAGAA